MTLSPLEAYEALMRFARERGEGPLQLSMHAAVPQSFRPGFLHLTKLNFVPSCAADPSLESDVLHASFCHPVGAGYYQFDPQVRALLLENLQAEFGGPGRLRTMAAFLLSYLDERERALDSTQDRLGTSYVEVERWVALAILDPEGASCQLAAALNATGPAGTAAARLRIGGLVNALAGPLLRYPRLADYATGIAALERGDVENGRRLLSSLGSAELEIGPVKLRPANVVLEHWGVPHASPKVPSPHRRYLSCLVGFVLGPQTRDFVPKLFENLRQAGVDSLSFPAAMPMAFRDMIDERDALIIVGSSDSDAAVVRLAHAVAYAVEKQKRVVAVSLNRSWSIPFRGTVNFDATIDFSDTAPEPYDSAFDRLLDALSPRAPEPDEPPPPDEFVGRALPLTQEGLQWAVKELSVDPAVLWAVVSVETLTRGFQPDRRPVMIFERHVFSRLTHRRFDSSDISNPVPGGYSPDGVRQYEQLAKAIVLDRNAALQSCSWGIGQILGTNFARAGFADVDEMVAAMCDSEDAQLRGIVRFLQSAGLNRHLQERDWASFVKAYSGGPSTEKAARLQEAYSRYSAGSLPNLDIRAAQLLLSYQGHYSGAIDGRMNRQTRDALHGWQLQQGLPSTGELDAATLASLHPDRPADLFLSVPSRIDPWSRSLQRDLVRTLAEQIGRRVSVATESFTPSSVLVAVGSEGHLHSGHFRRHFEAFLASTPDARHRIYVVLRHPDEGGILSSELHEIQFYDFFRSEENVGGFVPLEPGSREFRRAIRSVARDIAHRIRRESAQRDEPPASEIPLP